MINHLRTIISKTIIKGTVEAQSPLHIGWQRSFDVSGSDSPVMKDIQGRPFIPGSSFKGILRSFIEGFLSGAGKTDCFSSETEGEWCVAKEDWKDENKALEKACIICRLFGSPFIGSKVKFKDMPVDAENWHESFLQVRDGVVIDRESRTAKDGGKYDYEIISAGATFKMEIVAQNLSDEELGLLLVAFDLISRGFGSIGGNVSRGTGKIAIQVTEIETLNPKEFFENFKEDKTDSLTTIIKGDDLKEYKEKIRGAFLAEQTPAEEEAAHV